MKFNKFIAALFLAMAVAYAFPEGPEILPLKTITDFGIAFIFFFYGLKLSPQEFRLGLSNYKVHILVQLTSFLIFPLLSLLFIPFFEDETDSNLWLALFFLGALPSTVSSSVVMVSLARGDVPTAIFNASLSGLIGIFITPLWLSIFMSDSAGFEFLSVIQKLFLQVLLPLVIGLILQRFLGIWARHNSSKISVFDKVIIALIVYSSFAAAFSSGLFAAVGSMELLKLFLMVLLMFFLVYFGLGKLCQWLGWPIEDRITAQFCGTKKSLVHGSVMVKIIFGSSATNALFLLPIMLYHISQLLIIAVFAEKYRIRQVPEKMK